MTAIAILGASAFCEKMLRVASYFVELVKWMSKLEKKPLGVEDKRQEAVDFRKAPEVWNTVIMFPQRGPVEAGVDTTAKLLGFIQEAQASLQIVMFVASHSRFEEVVKRKYQEKIQIQIITNTHYDGSLRGGLSRGMRRLMKMGIPVKAPKTAQLMHNKYIIIDGEAVLTGSLNWSKEAFEGNWENVLVTTNQGLVQPYVENFNQLWETFDNVSNCNPKQNFRAEQSKLI